MNRSIKIRGLLPLAALAAALLAGNAAAESLQQAWDIALTVDRGLKASRESTAAASSLLDAAKSARLPNLALEAGYTALDKAPAARVDFFGQSLQMPLAQKDSAAYRAMATLPLYTGGRIERGIDAATAGMDAARLGETADAQNLKLRVADAYVNVLRASRMLKVTESHVASLQAHARDVGNLHEQGMVAKSDLLSVQVALADARQRHLQVANGLDLARAAYNRLLGRPLDQPVALDDLSPETAQEPLPALSERALARRSELAALARQIEAMRHQAAAVRGETAPQVALSGGYGYQENRYQVHQGQWMVTLGVKWSLFDGGVVSHRANAVERQAAALTEQRDELASIIALQVRQTWLDVQETRKRLIVTQSAIAQAEENLRVARDRYANGLSTHTEVLDAETLRTGSEGNHANALSDAALAGLRLKRATGEL
ncbi:MULTISPECIES: TolC family protein [Burkholderiales]|uniref:Outer membrane efflux protein n=1 Tax=Polaromonas naphthalenivorans (strain CJ2) TaxID=365044 RepID=A1VUY9_POLNA|nr:MULTISPECIES: TolC family protein [Burkholderiales]ABM39467.1 outer membrane efflux protein [Polaromonas naphthalenivorans CJ2]